ncbi:MAG: protein kinase [Holophagales bacterium]|nr:protein kinase [Holophagales bacterium]
MADSTGANRAIPDPRSGRRQGAVPGFEDAETPLRPWVVNETGERSAFPSRIGPYRIEASLGVGGMGQVLRAFDEDLARPVAIKLIHAEMIEGLGKVENVAQRFRREAQAVARLNHPNIVQIYHILETQHGDAIVMEHVHGRSLAQVLAAEPPGLERAVAYGRQIAEGLAEAHAKGIVHRDLKAANVMLTADDRVKILDFGLAKAFKPQLSWDGREDPATVLEISAGEVLGSYDSMSPEQIHGKAVGPASDLFSLGLLLYALVSGRKPFGEGSVVDVVGRICSSPHPPLRSLVPEVPESLDRLLDRLLEKQPRDRPGSATEVVEALAAIDVEIRGDDAPSGDAVARETASRSYSATALRAILAFELVDREALWDHHGPREVGRWMSLHDTRVGELAEHFGGVQIEEVHGQTLLFELPIRAIGFAMEYHAGLELISREAGAEIVARVGIHFGEIRLRRVGASVVDPDVAPFEVEGMAKAVAEGLMHLAARGQTLLTRGAFDLARNASREGSTAEDLRWLAHGNYRLEGVREPVGVCEVGREGRSPLLRPRSPSAVRLGEAADRNTIFGWRPAVGQGIPRRADWVLEGKLGEGGFGEVWKAYHRESGEGRVFKFCFEAERLRALQREITLFRLLKEELGERPDIARILEWNFDQAPYFIESEYTEGGNLVDWYEACGGAAEVPLALRLEIVAQVAEALAAAHSVGVLHKDVKPANVLISTADPDRPRARLADFGVGMVTDGNRLERAGITMITWPGQTGEPGGGAGLVSTGASRLYQAPELLEGKVATVQADVYSLGVLLYQAVLGDFGRALGPGWERDIDDELLREDIAEAVDASPGRRLDHVAPLATRLRSLEARRREREEEQQEARAAERVQAELAASRRRRKLWAAALLVTTLFGGAMAYQAGRIAREAERANQAAETASRVSRFLVGLFRTSDPWQGFPGETPTLESFLARGAEQVRDELQGQPLVQASLMETLGEVYHGLGDYEAALELLRGALDRRHSVQGVGHPDTVESLAMVGDILLFRSEYEEAEACFDKAIEVRRAHLGPEHPSLADLYQGLSQVMSSQGRYEESQELAERGLALLIGAGEQWEPQRGSLLLAIAHLEERRGDYADAERRLTEGLEIWSRYYGPDSVNLAQPLAELGHLYVQMHRFDQAKELMRRARDLLEQWVAPNHPYLAATATGEGDLLRLVGDLDGAKESYLEALDILDSAGVEAQNPLLRFPYHGLAMIHWRQNEDERARGYFEKMLVAMPASESGLELDQRDRRRIADFQRFSEQAGDGLLARRLGDLLEK